jgi:hypothetical protein
MNKKTRFPRLASAIAVALMSSQSALASGKVQTVPAPVVPRVGTVTPSAMAPNLSEAAKIQALIGSIEHLPGAVFIRNGSEYDGARAAAHLRQKLDYAGKKIRTADDFIDKLASTSSMTGRPYQIRFADGHTVDSAVFFHEQLKRLQTPPARKTAKG